MSQPLPQFEEWYDDEMLGGESGQDASLDAIDLAVKAMCQKAYEAGYQQGQEDV